MSTQLVIARNPSSSQLVAQIPLQLCLLIVCEAKYLLTYLLTRLFTFNVNKVKQFFVDKGQLRVTKS